MYSCLEEEVLEEVGGIDDGEDEDGGEVDCEDGAHQSSSQHKHKLNTIIRVGGINEVKVPVYASDTNEKLPLVFGLN